MFLTRAFISFSIVVFQGKGRNAVAIEKGSWSSLSGAWNCLALKIPVLERVCMGCFEWCLGNGRSMVRSIASNEWVDDGGLVSVALVCCGLQTERESEPQGVCCIGLEITCCGSIKLPCVCVKLDMVVVFVWAEESQVSIRLEGVVEDGVGSLGNDVEFEIEPILMSCEGVKCKANCSVNGLYFDGACGTCKEGKRWTRKGENELAALDEVVWESILSLKGKLFSLKTTFGEIKNFLNVRLKQQ